MGDKRNSMYNETICFSPLRNGWDLEYELDDFGNVTIVDDGDDVIVEDGDIFVPPRRVSRLLRRARAFMFACIIVFLFLPSFIASEESLIYVSGVISDNAMTLSENGQRAVALASSECERVATRAVNVIDAAGTLVFGQIDRSAAELEQEN